MHCHYRKRLCYPMIQVMVAMLCLHLLPFMLKAQNLVDNPDFEIYSECPDDFNHGNPMYPIPWLTIVGSSDYLNECAVIPALDIPTNFKGYQPAQSGTGYVGMYTVLPTGGYREFVQSPLLSPLEANECYYVSAWINLSNVACGCDQYGVLFTETNNTNVIGLNPQVKWTGGPITDTIGWTHLEGYFTAVGTEQYITLGNFAPNNQTQFDPTCGSPNANSYYYVDNILVEKIQVQTVDLYIGDDAVACDSFVIDPPDDNTIAYFWSTGHVGPTLTVYTSGHYTATRYWDCMEGVGEIDVTIQHPVYVDLNPELVYLCEGDTYEISLDPDLGTYTWDDGSVGNEYTILESGLYSVTLDDGCVQSADSVLVITAELPVPFTLGPDRTLCPGDTIHYTFDPSMGMFAWQDGSASNTYAVTGPGTYELTVSNFCGDRVDEVIITQGQAPQLVFNPDTIWLCPQSSYTLNLDTLSGNFFWQDGSTASSLTINTSGLYSVTVSNSCGADMDTLWALPDTLPDVELGAAIDACPGDTVHLSAGGPDQQYLWTGGSVSPSLQVTMAGTYTVTVTNTCGSNIDSVQVQFTQTVLSPDLGPDRVLCLGQSIILDPGITNVNYVWSDGSSMPSFSVSGPGTYAVTVSNSCSVGMDSVTFTAGEPIPMIDLGPDISICSGDMIVLQPTNDHVTTWLWPDGSTASTYLVTGAGEVTVAVSNTCGSATDTMQVAVTPDLPPIDLGVDTALCPGEMITLNANLTGGQLLWSDGSTGNSLTVANSGIVYVTGSNPCSIVSDTIVVNMLPAIPALSLGPNQSICPGEWVALSPGITGVMYLWQDGSTLPTYQTNQPEVIILTISNACGMDQDTLELTANTVGPQVDLGPDVVACVGDTITLYSGVIGVQYVWQDGSVAPDFVSTSSGTYMVTVSNSCGTDADTVDVVFDAMPPQPDLGADTTLCNGQSLTLQGGNATGAQYIWQDMSTGPMFVVQASGLYYLIVFNHCGTMSDTIDVGYQSVPIDFSLGPDTLICQGASFSLFAPITSDPLTWQDGTHSPQYLVNKSGVYWLQLTNKCGQTADTVVVQTDDQEPVVDFVGVPSLCQGEHITLDATQPFPAQYAWNTGQNVPILDIDAPGLYTVTVTTPCYTSSASADVIQNQDCAGLPEFYIPNVFSPNSDGINDVFTVIPSSIPPGLQISGALYDRWGNQVYAESGDSFSWDGQVSGVAVNPGVFVYLIRIAYDGPDGQTEVVLQGDVSVVR